jgi:hypothetical protein
MKQIKINLPFLYNVRDYHELQGISALLSDLTGEAVRHRELELEDEDAGHVGYWGVFYVGKCPSKQLIDQMYKMA